MTNVILAIQTRTTAPINRWTNVPLCDRTPMRLKRHLHSTASRANGRGAATRSAKTKWCFGTLVQVTSATAEIVRATQIMATTVGSNRGRSAKNYFRVRAPQLNCFSIGPPSESLSFLKSTLKQDATIDSSKREYVIVCWYNATSATDDSKQTLSFVAFLKL